MCVPELKDRLLCCQIESLFPPVLARLRLVNVSQTCRGQYIGLEEIDHQLWDVHYGPIRLGRFHEHSMMIEDEFGRLKRKVHRSK